LLIPLTFYTIDNQAIDKLLAVYFVFFVKSHLGKKQNLFFLKFENIPNKQLYRFRKQT